MPMPGESTLGPGLRIYHFEGSRQDRVHIEFSNTVVLRSRTIKSEVATPEFDSTRLSV